MGAASSSDATSSDATTASTAVNDAVAAQEAPVSHRSWAATRIVAAIEPQPGGVSTAIGEALLRDGLLVDPMSDTLAVALSRLII